jgi:hypothetical protein
VNAVKLIDLLVERHLRDDLARAGDGLCVKQVRLPRGQRGPCVFLQ